MVNKMEKQNSSVQEEYQQQQHHHNHPPGHNHDKSVASDNSSIECTHTKPNDWDFLSEVHKLLIDGNVLNTPASEPIVRFEHPEELLKKIDFKIERIGIDDHEKIKEICQQIIHYSVKTNHPHFHNQLFGAVDPYALAGSWITEALNTSQYTYEVGPAFTLMENEIIQMFSNRFGYKSGDGIFSPGGSISNMYGMVLARYQAIPNIKNIGLMGLNKPLVAFTSEDAHYSLKKSVHWLGIGIDNLIIIDTDNLGRMLIDDLENKIELSIKNGKQPFFVNATAGTTVMGAFDDFGNIARICEKYQLWLHVDACLGGSVILSKKHCHLLNGIERSDSISWNPHKCLGVPLQCSMILIKQKGLLHACNSAEADYLFQQDKFYDVSYDTGDKSVQCGRKIDIFKFWLMLKVRGLNGMEQLIDNAMSQSKYLIEQIEKRKGFRLITYHDKSLEFQFTNVCFWYIPQGIRHMVETDAWLYELYKVAPEIKEKMIKCGSLMVGYSPLIHKNMGNFFRMALSCHPVANNDNMDFILNEIERLGELKE